MQFIDSIEIGARAGNGGPGLVSFMRARNMPKLGPDGGDGGFGGNVIMVANPQLNTLSNLRYHRKYVAESGEKGGVNNRTGANGSDLILDVPLGTVILERETGHVVGEVLKETDRLIIAKGGKRGIGNVRFASSTNRAPQQHTPGGKGESIDLRLELKLVADIGFAGFQIGRAHV